MGENNATWQRKSILHRDTMFAASAIYKGKDLAYCILCWNSESPV